MCKCVCHNCHQELEDAYDEKYWQGQNPLGKALDEVREWLLKENIR